MKRYPPRYPDNEKILPTLLGLEKHIIHVMRITKIILSKIFGQRKYIIRVIWIIKVYYPIIRKGQKYYPLCQNDE